MKSNIMKILAAIFAAGILYLFLNILTIYTEPMKSFSLDLSLSPHTEGVFELNFDQKGWTVYTQTAETRTPLVPNGTGAYSGIEPGETFYYSRIIDEEIDSPMLKLGGEGDIAYAVFLDNTLLYTDYPELNHQIGHLTLPSGEIWHNEAITISFPPDYQGKTLTIAQSMPPVSDAGMLFAIPADVYLYCGYAYESELIAESFQVAIIAALAFFVGVILLLIFIWTPNFGTLFLSLSSFLWMALYLMETSFFDSYFGSQFYDHTDFIYMIIAGILLFYLCTRAGKYRKITYFLPVIYIVSLVISYFSGKNASQADISFSLGFMRWTSERFFLAELLIIIVLGIFLWFKEKYFYRLFLPGILIVNVGYWTFLGLNDPMAFSHLTSALKAGSVTYIYFRILPLFTLTAIMAALLESLKNEINRHSEKQLLEERQTMIQNSYENLKAQHQEILMLRHDMNRHFQLLYEINETEQVKEYLEELIGQNEKIRPVIISGNEILDIILNGKIGAAQNSGIQVEIEKAEAPEKLPLTDSDLCSLLMNILDNAITAATKSDLESPYLRLDIHVKDNFFYIFCENSAKAGNSPKAPTKDSVQKHGLGINIIKNITNRYDGIFDIEYSNTSFKLQIAIPIT